MSWDTNDEHSYAQQDLDKAKKQRETLSELGPLPQVHPRDLTVVHDARLELANAVDEIIKKYGLTTGEQLDLLMEVTARHIQTIAKYAIRHERGTGG